MRILRISRRGISGVVAAVLLVALTLTGGAILWAFSPRLPAQPSQIEYALDGGESVPAWGDGSDCSTVNGSQQCLLLPAFSVVITGESPGAMALALLQLRFICNTTVYLNATFQQMEWVPGALGTPPGSAPQLGHCGSYTPPKAAFNRFAFFQQLQPGATTLQVGDQLVVYAHTFTAFADDDFHGAPPWCYSIPNACTLEVAFLGQPSADVVAISLYGMST